jgi:predicted MFS family arabinose efflux permease
MSPSLLPSTSSFKWQLAALLFTAGAINYADRTAISSVLPLLKSDLGMSDTALGALGSVFLWAYAAGSPIAGFLADRFLRWKLVLLSLAAWSIVTLLTGLVQTTEQLLFMRVLLGAAECIYLPAAIAMLADYHPSETRGIANGIHTAGLNVGIIGGGVLAGYLGELHGWRASFVVLGVVGLVLTAGAYFFLRDSPEPEIARVPRRGKSGGLSEALDLLRIPSYLILVLNAMLVSIGTWIFFNWLPLFYREAFHLTLAQAGFSGTFMLQSAVTVGVPLGGILSDRVAGKHVQRRMLMQGIFYLLAAPFLLTFLMKPDYVVTSISIFAFAFLRGMGGGNENPMVCDLLAPHQRSTAVGLMNMCNSFAGGIGVLVAGMLKAGYGLGGTFAGVSVIVFAAGVLLLAGYFFFIRRDLARSL